MKKRKVVQKVNTRPGESSCNAVFGLVRYRRVWLLSLPCLLSALVISLSTPLLPVLSTLY